MTKVVANPARGEVEIEIDGETYILARTMGGLARLQSALKVEGLAPVANLIIAMDQRAFLEGVRQLAVAGDTDKLERAYVGDNGFIQIQEALMKVLAGRDAGNVTGGEEASQKPDSSLPAADVKSA